MNIAEERLKSILVDPGHISIRDFMDVKDTLKDIDGNVRDEIVKRDLLRPHQIDQLIADEIGFPYLSLKNAPIDEEVFSTLPEVMAKSRGVVATGYLGDRVKVGFLDPTDVETRHVVEKALGHGVIPYLVSKEDFEEVLSRYKSSINEEFNKIFAKLKDSSITREDRDQLVVTIVDTLIQYGYRNKASDIHIEPYRKKVVVRFRIDGVMHDVLEIPKKSMDAITTRIKIMSRLRTDEHRAAQDGKFRIEIGKEEADVRVSIVPVVDGENIVLRLLSSRNRRFSLDDLGLEEDDFERVKSAIKKPHGMVLVTGPTGSGKTTTVYAVLKILNTREVHISTIEDPVEYDIEGVSQIQVDVKTNLTFAKGLRSIVRQDPDIIMVGEIRDEETADIATNSAMTGHLVLSTLHANDAATTLPRLLDMGVEPFLVASTVNIVIAQRLVRKLCMSCRASASLTQDEKNIIKRETQLKKILKDNGYDDLSKVTIFKSEGCKTCGDTGYQGRTGIFEVLEVTDSIKDLVVKRASSEEVIKKAQEEGMKTMLEDGISKVLNGITSLNEVVRVTKT